METDQDARRIALDHMEAALSLLDGCDAPLGAAEHLDLAIQRLAQALGDPVAVATPDSWLIH